MTYFGSYTAKSDNFWWSDVVWFHNATVFHWNQVLSASGSSGSNVWFLFLLFPRGTGEKWMLFTVHWIYISKQTLLGQGKVVKLSNDSRRSRPIKSEFCICKKSGNFLQCVDEWVMSLPWLDKVRCISVCGGAAFLTTRHSHCQRGFETFRQFVVIIGCDTVWRPNHWTYPVHPLPPNVLFSFYFSSG